MMTDPYKIDIGETYYERTKQDISDVIGNVWSNTGFGSLQASMTKNLYGINHRQTPGMLPMNRDYYGLTFFTRPRLNLSTDNLRPIRDFGPLLTKTLNSYPRMIRCLLDPTLVEQGVTTPLVDPQQAFIPLLTNASINSTGWPDIEALTHTTREGVYKEAMAYVDSSVRLYGTYDITANFRNLQGDPINLMFLVWVLYSSLVYLGEMIPYPDALINNEIDYNTRIYRLVLDSTRRYVTFIAATGASFPVNVPLGAKTNHDADHPINQNLSQISIQFRSNGVMYNDPILYDEFNRTVALFHDGMNPKNFTPAKDNSGNSTNPYMQKIPQDGLAYFNNLGYPRINQMTLELEWWLDKDDYQARLQNLNGNRN